MASDTVNRIRYREEDLALSADFIDQVVLKEQYHLRHDEERRWQVEQALDRCQAREPYLADQFSRRIVNRDFCQQRHQQLMHQCF